MPPSMNWTADMHNLIRLVTNNWFLKLSSLLIAALLWVAVASETSSEIGIEVPLEYRNIPAELEVAGQTTNMVEVRLRGSSNLVNEVSAQDVATTIDLSNATAGENVFPLAAQNVSTPFGVDVVLVNPSRVRVTLERTLSRELRVTPVLDGSPANGYEVGQIRVIPERVNVRGPESRLGGMDSIRTVPLRIDGEQADIRELVDLDPGDSMIRLLNPSPVEVHVEIRPKQ
jgi:YbbR domain-containing protein